MNVFKIYGPRRFVLAGPSTWNSLPESFDQELSHDTFKRQLKIHFFAKC